MTSWGASDDSENDVQVKIGKERDKEFWKDVPIYKNVRMKISAPEEVGKRNILVYTSNDPLSKIAAFYEEELVKTGWLSSEFDI